MAIHPDNFLGQGDVLVPGDFLVSANKKFFIGFDRSGDLCSFVGTPMSCAGITWRAGTRNATRLVMKGAQLWLYTGDTVAWTSYPYGTNAFAIMQDDGNFVTYAGPGPFAQGAGIWETRINAPQPLDDSLFPGQVLMPGTCLQSDGGAFFATILDGCLRIYAGTPDNVIGQSWVSPFIGNGECRLVMQPDGNLVLSEAGSGAAWSTQTSGGNVFAVMQADGNLCVYEGQNKWDPNKSFKWGSLQSGGIVSNYPVGARPTPLTVADLNQAVARCGPLLHFHSTEPFKMCSIEAFLQHATLIDQVTGGTVVNPAVGQLPQGTWEDKRYFLRLDDGFKGGDLSTAKAYVRAKSWPGHSYTDLQFWLFYAYNGPGTARVKSLFLDTTMHAGEADLAPLGEHYGDWECCMVRVDNTTLQPIATWLSQHSGGSYFGDLSGFGRGRDSNQLVVYASRNGHAVYPGGGPNYTEHRKYGLPYAVNLEFFLRNDTDAGVSLDCSTHYEIISADGVPVAEPPWVNYLYRWGPEGDTTHMNPDTVRDILRAAFGFLGDVAAPLMTELAGDVVSIFVTDDRNGPYGPKTKNTWGGQY